MLIVGKRASGKTTMAIDRLLDKYNEGEIIGIVVNYMKQAEDLKYRILKRAKERMIKLESDKIKLIQLEDIKRVDKVIIDNLSGNLEIIITSDNWIETSL